jgi:hypothetical protein
MGDVYDPEPIDHLRVTECDVPGDEPTEVVSDDVGRFPVLTVDQLAHVGYEFRLSIGVDPVGCFAQITAPLVRDDHTEAGIDERPDLIAPAVPEIGMAVQEDDQWRVGVAGDDDV